MLAVVAAAALALIGCAVPLPLASPTAAPLVTAEPAPTAAASPTPGDAAADPDRPLAVVDGACTQLLLDEVASDPDEPFEEGFTRPELLEGLEVGCSGTQATPANEHTATFSFALVRAEEGTIETIDERILATSDYVRGDPVLPYYVDEGQAAWVSLYSGMVWEQLEGAGPFDDAEAWVLLRWHDPR